MSATILEKKPKKTIVKVSPDHEKYKMALKLINVILANIGKDQIDDLTKFVDVNREDIIKDINKQSLNDMEKEVFPLFSKDKCGYYRKTNSFVLNCLRGMMKEIGYSMRAREQKRQVDCKVTISFLYSIS